MDLLISPVQHAPGERAGWRSTRRPSALGRLLLLAVAVCLLSLIGSGVALAKSRKATNHAAQAKPSSEKVASSFEAFCQVWMGKLAARQRDNVSHIKWEQTADGLQGTYVGYSTEHQCTLAEDSAVPVGKIAYREVTYRRSGANIAEAERNPPEKVEEYEVTELFEYTNGKWDY